VYRDSVEYKEHKELLVQDLHRRKVHKELKVHRAPLFKERKEH
jgi:hypothetical protein